MRRQYITKLRERQDSCVRKRFQVSENGETKVVQDVLVYEQTQESMALLKILAIGNTNVREGKFKPRRRSFDDLDAIIKEFSRQWNIACWWRTKRFVGSRLLRWSGWFSIVLVKFTTDNPSAPNIVNLRLLQWFARCHEQLWAATFVSYLVSCFRSTSLSIYHHKYAESKLHLNNLQ